jgi:hypothetical protein
MGLLECGFEAMARSRSWACLAVRAVSTESLGGSMDAA